MWTLFILTSTPSNVAVERPACAMRFVPRHAEFCSGPACGDGYLRSHGEALLQFRGKQRIRHFGLGLISSSMSDHSDSVQSSGPIQQKLPQARPLPICAVVVTYRPGIEMLENLNAILQQVDEVVVVDNCSNTDELDALHRV